MTASCRQCGRALVDARCPECSNGTILRVIHREIIILLVLGAIVAGLFLATRSLAAAHRDLRRRDGAEWFRQGRAELAAGRPQQALEPLRRATTIDVDNVEYRLALAAALEGAGRIDTARQVLLALRQDAPERPEINLRLARLDAQRGDDSAAIRYYQNALYGVWPDGAEPERRALRFEFIRYLLQRKHTDRALAELIATGATLDGEPSSHIEAGDLFLRAGDARRALAQHRAALRREPGNVAALAGAASAAFTLGDYAAALRYLRTVPDDREGVSEIRTIASLVLGRDPLLPRLSYAERRRRLELNLSDASARLTACRERGQGAAVLDSFQENIDALRARLRRSSVREALEAIEDGVELVVRIEEHAADRCGPPAAVDRAFVLIGQRHGS